MAKLKTCAKLAVQLLVWNNTVTDENRIAEKCLHFRIGAAVLLVHIMYAVYCLKSLEQVGVECNMCLNIFARLK